MTSKDSSPEETVVFDHKKLKSLRNRTPFFVFSKKAMLDNLKEYQDLLPGTTEICYAMKSNSEKDVLDILNKAGASFEVASKYELTLLKEVGVPAKRIIYGTSVKPERHIKEFVAYGVDRFAFDSEQELLKIARIAPKSRVYVRANVNDKSDSVFHMSEKFGTSLNEAGILLAKAKELGLVPYGISFNVGSQARNEKAWGRGIKEIGKAMERFLKDGIKIEIINIGGGFPFSYQEGDGFPDIEKIATYIAEAVKELPYKVGFIAEPGRGIVANAYALVTSVIGKSIRPNGEWIYVDAGVYNALLEAMTTQGSTEYRLEPLLIKKTSDKNRDFILTGPTGDNIDVVTKHALLPSTIDTGDKILINDVGAYTFPLITRFNGFPKPRIIDLS